MALICFCFCEARCFASTSVRGQIARAEPMGDIAALSIFRGDKISLGARARGRRREGAKAKAMARM